MCVIFIWTRAADGYDVTHNVRARADAVCRSRAQYHILLNL